MACGVGPIVAPVELVRPFERAGRPSVRRGLHPGAGAVGDGIPIDLAALPAIEQRLGNPLYVRSLFSSPRLTAW